MSSDRLFKTQTHDDEFFFLRVSETPRIKLQGIHLHFSYFERVGIQATKFEKTRIHFNAVAIVVAKAP